MLSAADVDRVAPLLDERTIALAAPEVPLSVRERLLETAGSSFRVAGVARAEVPEASRLLSRCDLVALNADEAAAVAGCPLEPTRPHDMLERCARALTALQPSMSILVTAGRRGAFAFSDGSWVSCPGMDVEVASTAGAGDALLGGVLAALAAGAPLTAAGPQRTTWDQRPITSALELGVCLASLAVTSPHTIPPAVTLDALRAFVASRGVVFGETLGRLVEEAA
jgi:sugar/nucleoside kinase (ribokinase family)